tara:strand:- start:654 stop:887 length:234 start_codon:yes stop_codon:yes gene_type:complete
LKDKRRDGQQDYLFSQNASLGGLPTPQDREEPMEKGTIPEPSGTHVQAVFVSVAERRLRIKRLSHRFLYHHGGKDRS